MIKEEVCEKELERQKEQEEINNLTYDFDIPYDKEYCTDDKKEIRFIHFKIHKLSNGSQSFDVATTEQVLYSYNLGFIERWLKKKKVHSYYSNYGRPTIAYIYPEEKKVVVMKKFFYEYFKEKAEKAGYKTIVKCWDGAT